MKVALKKMIWKDDADFDLSHTAPEEDQNTVGARRTCWIKRWWMLRMPC
jgi:hypothetical protein